MPNVDDVILSVDGAATMLAQHSSDLSKLTHTTICLFWDHRAVVESAKLTSANDRLTPQHRLQQTPRKHKKTEV